MKFLKFCKEVRHLLETGLVFIIFSSFKYLPVKATSKFCAFLIKTLFSVHKSDKSMRANLALSFKKKSKEEIDEIADKVWENLGMSFAEYPFFVNCSKEQYLKHVEIVGFEEYLEPLIKSEKGYIMFSAHFSNWEVIYPMFKFYKMKGNLFYRPNSNKWLDNYTIKIREVPEFKLQPKGTKGVKAALETLLQGGALATFIDQKYNEGIAVPFFGRKAMTTPLMANLHLKYGFPLIPIHAERIGHVKYRLIIEAPLTYKQGENNKETAYNIMLKANKTMEKWIKKYPEQWFWLHKRWPKK